MGEAGTQDTWTRSTDPGCGGFCQKNGQIMFWPQGYSILTNIPETDSANPPDTIVSGAASTDSTTTTATALVSITHTASPSDTPQGGTTVSTTASSLRRKRSENLGSEQSQPGGSVAKKPKVLTKPMEGSTIATDDFRMTQGTTFVSSSDPEPEAESVG